MLYPEAIVTKDFDNHREQIPLHMVVAQPEKLRAFIRNLTNPAEDILVADRYGQTVLHHACMHHAPMESIRMIIETNPNIIHLTTRNRFHALRVLWDCYIVDRAQHTYVNGILDGEEWDQEDVPEHFLIFWEKMEFLACQIYAGEDIHMKQPSILHGLLMADAHVDILIKVCCRVQPTSLCAIDKDGNSPLHILLSKQRSRTRADALLELFLECFPDAASVRNNADHLPLHLALRHQFPGTLDDLVWASPLAVQAVDSQTGLYPFQLAASMDGMLAVNRTFLLLTIQPNLMRAHFERSQC